MVQDHPLVPFVLYILQVRVFPLGPQVHLDHPGQALQKDLRGLEIPDVHHLRDFLLFRQNRTPPHIPLALYLPSLLAARSSRRECQVPH